MIRAKDVPIQSLNHPSSHKCELNSCLCVSNHILVTKKTKRGPEMSSSVSNARLACLRVYGEQV